MDRIVLGKTGIEVTRLCFGALPLGPLQKNLSVDESAEIIAYALDNGINFIDTAQMYGTYPHIKKALAKVKSKPVIASKSAAENYEEMEMAIQEAIEGLGVDYIDIFHLHAARVEPDVFDLRKGALRCLLEYKDKGIIKAVGISAHDVRVVEGAAARQDIDVVFPLLNKTGRGILSGTREDMERAIEKCRENGKGVYLMKVLGGGTLIDDYQSCVEYALNLKTPYPIAMGMVSKEEVAYNIRFMNGERNFEDVRSLKSKKSFRISQSMCISCGKCIEACHSGAAGYNHTGKAHIDSEKCVQCGYCVASCPQFAIRLV